MGLGRTGSTLSRVGAGDFPLMGRFMKFAISQAHGWYHAHQVVSLALGRGVHCCGVGMWPWQPNETAVGILPEGTADSGAQPARLAARASPLITEPVTL